MAISVKKVQLWRRELQNHPGALAESLRPIVESKVNLQLIMGYVYQDNRRKAALEIHCPSSRSAESAASKGKFQPARHVHCVMVEGNDRPGLGYDIARSLGSSRINMSFAIMQTVGHRYAGVFGFESEAAAGRAMGIIKAVSASAAGGHRRMRRMGGARRVSAVRMSSKRKAGSRVLTRRVGSRRLATMAAKPASRKKPKAGRATVSTSRSRARKSPGKKSTRSRG